MSPFNLTVLFHVFILFHFSVIDETPPFDFVFLFTCREINILLDNIKNAKELLRHKYPEVFDIISLSDLEPISDRVLIVVDGLDELQKIYDINEMNKRPLNFELVSSLIDTKKGIFKNHKVIVCGRPKACELVKQQFKHKSKTIEVCGFNEDNIVKYIHQFFNQREVKTVKVKEALRISSNLKVMATVPVFLWVICSVYDQELITKPLNTYTELYTYASLIFLRNHFRGKSKQNSSMSLFDVLENDEIMNSVYALMGLSVQTYMQNKVLFKEDDIKIFICPTQLEKTGFILRYNRGNLRKPVYQFKHLVLQEYFCGLSLCVTKWVSPYISNRELSSCAPVIFGINRLLKEGQNELFISFFNKLSKINSLKMRFVTKYILMPYRHRIFRKYLSRNSLEIPDCMIRDDVLSINASVSECQEFMILLFESRFKLECPFTSSKIVGDFSETDYRNALFLMKTLKLKLQIPDSMIDGDTLFINRTSYTFIRFVKDGIEIDKHITRCEIVGKLSETNYKNAFFLLKTLKLKLQIPDSMIDGDTLFINRTSYTFIRFVKDGIEIDKHITRCEIVGKLSETNYKNAFFLLKTLKLKLKIPDSMIDGDTIVINRTSYTFIRLVYDGVEYDEHLFTSPIFSPPFIHNLSGTQQKVKFVEINEPFNDNSEVYVAAFIQHANLTLKLPSCMVRNGVFHIDFRFAVFQSFMQFFNLLKDDAFLGISTSGISYIKCYGLCIGIDTGLQRLVEILNKYSFPSLKYLIPAELVIGSDFVINSSEGCLNTIWKIPLNVELLHAHIVSSIDREILEEIPTFLLNLGMKIKIPESMMKEKFILTIDLRERETRNFISNAKILHVNKSMLVFNDNFKSAEVNGYGTESELENVVYILKTLDEYRF